MTVQCVLQHTFEKSAQLTVDIISEFIRFFMTDKGILFQYAL